MDTLTFLQAVLPEDGVYYLVLFLKGKPGKIHKSFTDLAAMAEAVTKYNNDPRIEAVYHACAAYNEPCILSETETYADGNPKKQYRIKDNWRTAKAFWLDLDCSEEKARERKGYATKKDAAVAVAAFARDIGWPQPMLVDSGSGLHAYWPLTKALKPEPWKAMATVLKAALERAGVLADPSRTADYASILRPAGTTNRKHGGTRNVACKREATPTHPRKLADTLQKWVRDNEVRVKAPPTYTAPPVMDGDNGDLAGLVRATVPSSGATAADHCLQMQRMRDTKGDVDYETWRKVLGVLKHCEDGKELAREWTEEREATDHESYDWWAKYESWNAGPATCESFQTSNAAGCTGCLHKGKVKSPIMLGRVVPISVETETEVVDAATGAVEVVTTPALPSGYNFQPGAGIVRFIKDKEGTLHPHAFCKTMFYPTAVLRASDGTNQISIRAHKPNGQLHTFDIPYAAVAATADTTRALCNHGVHHSNDKDAGNHMAAYLRDQLDVLKMRADEISSMSRFGWHNDSSFLLGERLYLPDGTVRKVHLGGDALNEKDSLPEPRGTLAMYARAINYMYAREGAEHWQYVVCAGWGSLLTPLCDTLYKGLLMAVQGGDTGKGKTTACQASMYAFGDANEMTIPGKDGATNNARWATVAAFGSIPVLLDELTSMAPADFSNLAYGVSSGQERRRLKSHAGKTGLGDRASWRLSPFVTGNCDFYGVLAAQNQNSQAEAVRLIQIDADHYAPIKLHPDPKVVSMRVQRAVDTMRDNAGSAGEALVQYVVLNRELLKDEVTAQYNQMADYLPDPKYRFYRWHAACTLTIARVAKRLAIINFDLDRLTDWSVNMITALAGRVTQSNCMTPEEAFHTMWANLRPRIIVTSEFRKNGDKKGPETPHHALTGDVAGRFVLGTSSDPSRARWLTLSSRAVQEWCDAKRMSLKAIEDYLRLHGALREGPEYERQTLTRGTTIGGSQARCIVIDTKKLDVNHLSLVVSPATDTESLDVEAVGS